VTLADTAGLSNSGGVIEAEGVRRARARAEQADLKLVLFDRTVPADAPSYDLIDSNTIVLFNKSDLVNDEVHETVDALAQFTVSVKTGEGIDSFLYSLSAAVRERIGFGDAPMITRSRHRSALSACRDALIRATVTPESELAAEDLRLAVRALGRITGSVDVEDLLDIIFRDFCIGK